MGPFSPYFPYAAEIALVLRELQLAMNTRLVALSPIVFVNDFAAGRKLAGLFEFLCGKSLATVESPT